MMYSLYRAWLMRDAVAAASLASPPDVVITVGNPDVELSAEGRGYGCQFVAHRHLVSLHSGYLKSLIQSETNLGAGSIATVSLPSISPEAFAPLLSFMYTGFLDLTNENIYSVLLATHLLHMPRALDLCRAYLVQNQPDGRGGSEYGTAPSFQFHANPNIVKPIPSRKIQHFSHPFWPPMSMPPLFLQASPSGPFQSVSATDNRVSAPQDRHREPASPPAVPSTSKTAEATPPSPVSGSASPCPTNASFTSDDRTVHIVKSPQRKAAKRKDAQAKNAKRINNENLKVVLDVACCDGPVRFHRVLNECYGMSLDEIMDDAENDRGEQARDEITDKEYLDNYPKAQFLNLKSNKKFSNFMHQQMLNSNLFIKKSKSSKGVIQLRKIIEKKVLAQEKTSRDENDTEIEAEEESAGKIYTCVYCKHTFKSQYCYQKHARRHINPVEDGGGSSKNLVIVRKVVSTTKVDGKDGECGSVRREVRLLDMNVQYYPCKTCGSKFPSYYFVHKHRKLCHSGEEALDENSNHQPEECDLPNPQRA